MDNLKFAVVDEISDGDFEIFVKNILSECGWTDLEITKVGKEYKHGDGGVDIFGYKADRKFAIEVKQRKLGNNVDVSALNQLVTGARLANVKNLILVTNSYFTSEVRVRALRLGVELIDRDSLKDLWETRSSEIGRRIKPRKYQDGVINESLRAYNNNKSKILIEMATGLGKTYTVAILIKRLIQESDKRCRVLFVAHQVEILLQSVTAFKNILGIGDYSYSACFDGSDPEETDFVFASFDTLFTKINNLSEYEYDYVIIDEAHHVPARTYSTVTTYFTPKLLIGLTATPYRTDNKSVLDYFGGSDGHIGKYDLVWGLKHRKLAFPKYMVMLNDMDQSKIDQLNKGLSISDIDKRLFLNKKDEEIVSIISRAIKEKSIDNVKGIVFCRNINHMKQLIQFFDAGSAVMVHSKLNDQQRRDRIREFREGAVKFILVVDLFNEGVDVPEVNLLVFVRYTGSRTIWLQQLGRGLRKTSNKDYVHVLDFVGSLERLNEINELKDSIDDTVIEIENLIEEDDANDASINNNLSEERSDKGLVYDDAIEVNYNESAAKVLDLIEELKYRLATRSNLIDKIGSYYDQFVSIPEIHQVEDLLEDVYVDQISTHFDSYLGYIESALGSSLGHIYDPKYKLVRHVKDFYLKYGVVPTCREVSISFQFKSLLEFTEKEIKSLVGEFNSIVEDRVEGKDSVSLNAEREKKSSSDVELELINKYKSVVGNRKDIVGLDESEKENIILVFGSISRFLVKLKRS